MLNIIHSECQTYTHTHNTTQARHSEPINGPASTITTVVLTSIATPIVRVRYLHDATSSRIDGHGTADTDRIGLGERLEPVLEHATNGELVRVANDTRPPLVVFWLLARVGDADLRRGRRETTLQR